MIENDVMTAAVVPAAVRAWRELEAAGGAPSVYAGRVARARDSREVGLMLWQVEGAMRSLERTAELRYRARGGDGPSTTSPRPTRTSPGTVGQLAFEGMLTP
jgi:hypothetical protein